MKQIDKEVKLTMASIDGIKRAEPSQIFNHQLMERIKGLPNLDYWAKWTKIALVAMIILSFGNLTTIFLLDRYLEPESDLSELVDQSFDTSSDLYSINDQAND